MFSRLGRLLDSAGGRRCGSLAALGLPIVLLTVLFGPALLGERRLAFRDVGHFYTPLYDYVNQRPALWQLPLWSPLDHTGVPLAGESTTALFYPLRIVFCVGLPSDVAMTWYVVIHLVLAAWGAGWAASVAGARTAGSAVAAIGYPLAGPVLFLYCNPPFLVGAAWLPIALAAALRCGSGGGRRRVAAAAAALAMPVLAGDPQTTYHILIVLALAAAGRLLLLTLQRRRTTVGAPGRGAGRAAGKSALLTAMLLAAGLTAPQLAASIDWARHSDRWSDRPPGVSRLLDDAGPGGAEARGIARWWQTPPADSHTANIYAFSVGPWHWSELLVPAAGGQLFPQYRRLSSLLPDDGRTWTLTLYGGLLPLLAWGARLRESRGRWDVWDGLAPMGLLFALGVFGPVWIVRQLSQSMGGDALSHVHAAIGGPYWTLVSCLPGYGSFRYPAKWLPFLALGISIAAARYVSRLNRRRRRTLFRGALIAAVVSSIVATTTGWAVPRQWLLAQLPAGLPADRFWGPLDADAALFDVALSSMHVAVVALATAGCLCLSVARRWRRSLPLVLAVVLAVDLLVVGWPQIATVDRSLETALLRAGGPANKAPELRGRWMRTRAGAGWPKTWSESHSPHRVSEVEISQRASLFARWHLDRRVGVFNGAVSISPQRYTSFWDAADEMTHSMTAQQRRDFWIAVSRWLGLQGHLLTTEQAVAAKVEPAATLQLVETQTIAIRAPLPQARWHARWRTIDPQRRVSVSDWTARLQAVADDPQAVIPLLESAGDPAIALEDRADAVSLSVVGSVETLGTSEEAIRLRVTAVAPGMVSLRQFQDGNWQCRYRRLPAGQWRTAAVGPVDYLAMGSVLPAGTHEVEFRYRPRWLTPSLLVMLVCGACLLWMARPEKQPFFTHLRLRLPAA